MNLEYKDIALREEFQAKGFDGQQHKVCTLCNGQFRGLVEFKFQSRDHLLGWAKGDVVKVLATIYFYADGVEYLKAFEV